MIREKIFTVFLILMILPVRAPAEMAGFDPASAREDGLKIAKTVDKKNRPRQDLSMYGTMTLISGESTTDTRQVAMRQKTFDHADRYALRFLDSIKRGVTFLTIENQDADNDQYLYIPALGRARKVAVNDRQNAFEDTDFSYEDLGGLRVEDYLHKRMPDSEFNGRQCYRIQSNAKDKSARYPKKTSWIDKQTYLPVQVRFFGRQGDLQRVIVAGDIHEVKDIHIPFKTVAKDLRANHTTVIVIKEAKADTGLDNAGFDPKRMGETWR